MDLHLISNYLNNEIDVIGTTFQRTSNWPNGSPFPLNRSLFVVNFDEVTAFEEPGKASMRASTVLNSDPSISTFSISIQAVKVMR